MMRALILVLLCTPALAVARGQAADAVRSQGYVVYYSAVTGNTIPPSVALRHGIPDRRDVLVVNISVIKGPDAAQGVAIPARVTGKAVTLLGRTLDMHFHEVRERDGMVYYLALVHAKPPDTLRLDVRVTPPGARTIPVQFDQDVP